MQDGLQHQKAKYGHTYNKGCGYLHKLAMRQNHCGSETPCVLTIVKIMEQQPRYCKVVRGGYQAVLRTVCADM